LGARGTLKLAARVDAAFVAAGLVTGAAAFGASASVAWPDRHTPIKPATAIVLQLTFMFPRNAQRYFVRPIPAE